MEHHERLPFSSTCWWKRMSLCFFGFHPRNIRHPFQSTKLMEGCRCLLKDVSVTCEWNSQDRDYPFRDTTSFQSTFGWWKRKSFVTADETWMVQLVAHPRSHHAVTTISLPSTKVDGRKSLIPLILGSFSYVSSKLREKDPELRDLTISFHQPGWLGRKVVIILRKHRFSWIINDFPSNQPVDWNRKSLFFESWPLPSLDCLWFRCFL